LLNTKNLIENLSEDEINAMDKQELEQLGMEVVEVDA